MSLLLLSDSEQIIESVGVANGLSTAAGVTAVALDATAVSVGTSTASAVGVTARVGEGSAVGISTVAGLSPQADASASGLAVVQGQAPIAEATATALSVVQGQTPYGEGLSQAFSTVTGFAPASVGLAVGLSTAAAFTPSGVGLAVGQSVVLGVPPAGTGLAIGTALAEGWAPIAEGSAVGSVILSNAFAPIAEAFAVGVAVVQGSSTYATGESAGVATAAAISAFSTAVAFTQGTGDAWAYGVQAHVREFEVAGLSTATAIGVSLDTGGGLVGYFPLLGLGLDATILERGLLRIAKKQPRTARDFVTELSKTYEDFAKNALPTPLLMGRRSSMENALLPAISNTKNPRNQSVNALVQSFTAFWLGVPLANGGAVTAFLGGASLAASLNRLFLQKNTTEGLAKQVAQCMFIATKQVQYIIPGNPPYFMV